MPANGTPRHAKGAPRPSARAPFGSLISPYPALSAPGTDNLNAQPLTLGLERISEIEIGKNVPGVLRAAEPDSQLLDGESKR